MALDLSGFNSGDADVSGLYKIGQDIRVNKQLNEQRAERQQLETDRQNARKTATATYLQGYLNPKHFLTGTNYDPVVTQGVSSILQKAMQLAGQGLDAPDITNAVAPDVADLSKATESIKALEAQRTEHSDALKNVKGIDIDKYNMAFKKQAYYNPDGSMKDLSTVDPNQNVSDAVLKNEDIFNNEGLNDFVKNSGHTVIDQNIKTRDANGRVHQAKVDITKPGFMISDTDAQGVHQGFVPKYTVATEGDGALLHSFKNDKGDEVKAPVRMVTDDVFDALPNTAKGYILQEVRSALKNHPEIPIGSTQAENLGKAIAYDELKNNAKDYSTMKRTDVNLAPLPPRITVNVGGAQQPQTIDLYNGDKNNVGLKQVVSDDAAKGFDYTRFSKVPQQVQTTLIKQARDISGDKNINNSNLYFHPNDVGDIELMQISGTHPDPKNDVSIMTVDPLTLNIPANQNVAKVGTGKSKPETINKVINTGSETKKSIGMSNEDFENFLKKNKLK